MYAKELTRKQLEADGITDITETGKVFKGDKEVKLSKTKYGYYVFTIYKRDAEGNLQYKMQPQKIHKKNGEVVIKSYKQAYKQTVTLQRAMYAWLYGVCPEGYVVDHINDIHDIENTTPDNLQLLTPFENLEKDRNKQFQVDFPKSFMWDYTEITNNISRLNVLNEKAKKDKDAEKTHNIRTKKAIEEAKLRKIESNPKESRIRMDIQYTIDVCNGNIKYYKDQIRMIQLEIKLLKEQATQYKQSGDKYMWHCLIDHIEDLKEQVRVHKDSIYCQEEMIEESKDKLKQISIA